MARKIAPGEFPKRKPSPVVGVMKEVVPTTPADAAWYAVPFGKAARVTGGITKKGAKYVGKIYRNMGK